MGYTIGLFLFLAYLKSELIYYLKYLLNVENLYIFVK